MDRLDRKIRKALSKKLKISEGYKDAVQSCIERLPHHYPPRRERKFLKTIPQVVAFCVVAVSAVSVCAYTGGTIIYNNIKNKQIEAVASEINTNYRNMQKAMNLKDDWYYKFLNSYDEYMKFKSYNYGQLLEMTEEDFNDSMLLLVFNSTLGYKGIYISDIKNTDNELEVVVRKDIFNKDNKENNELISLKLSKEMYSENIKFILEEGKFASVSRLPLNYTKEQALEDGYVVIYNEKIISDDANVIDNFIKDTRNGKEDQIRIIVFEDEPVSRDHLYKIIDISFINKTYELSNTQVYNLDLEDYNIDEINQNQYERKTVLYRFENLIKLEDEKYICYRDDRNSYIEIKK